MANGDGNKADPKAPKLSEMTLEQILDFMAASGIEQTGADYLSGFVYPSRIIRKNLVAGTNPQDFYFARGGGGTKWFYRGSFLVNENQDIERPQYDISPLADANTILLTELTKNPTTYQYFTNLLQTRGYYGNNKPSVGRVDDRDRAAMAEFLNNVANTNGVTYKVAFQMLEGMPQIQASGKKAPSVRLTSPDDLKVVFRKASRDLLGYELDDATAQRFVKSYQQMEVAEGRGQAAGGAYVSAAAPSTVAEKQILKQFKSEAQSFAAANYAQIMDESIKALGA